MRFNPYINAIAASAYIWGIALLFSHISEVNQNTPDPWYAPVIALSLLVFSVAMMGFLFFYRPAVLLMEKKHKEAVDFFLKTLGAFGVLTLIVLISIL